MNHELLFKLLDISSPSGCEDKIKEFLHAHLESLGIESRDMGRAGVSWELGKGEDLGLISAHIDQVGFVVERIDDEGYIYLRMPGVDPRVVPACEVTVWGRRPVQGIVGMVPPHYSSPEERKAPVPREKLFVDAGMSGEEVKKIVSIGDACTWNYRPARLLESRLTGVGLDNRAGLYLAILLAEKLKASNLAGRLRFFATTQEEGIMFGAGCAGREVLAEIEKVSFALVVDTTFATDHSVTDEAFGLGDGPTLGVGPILSRPHLDFLKKTASELTLSYSLEPLVRATGTEADILSRVDKGIPTILLSIPVRNMHTPVEVLDLRDVETSLTLLSAALAKEGFWSC